LRLDIAPAHSLGAEAFIQQLMLDARRAKTPGATVDHRLDHTRLADEVLGLQVIEHLGQLARRFLMRRQLAFQFGTRMLAPGQVTQGAPLERKAKTRTGGGFRGFAI
jgi:hypothetical protein